MLPLSDISLPELSNPANVSARLGKTGDIDAEVVYSGGCGFVL